MAEQDLFKMQRRKGLCSYMLDMYNESLELGVLPQSLREAYTYILNLEKESGS